LACFWKPNQHGYTYDIKEAGYYTEEDAKKIVAAANIVKVEEIMYPVGKIQVLAEMTITADILEIDAMEDEK